MTKMQMPSVLGFVPGGFFSVANEFIVCLHCDALSFIDDYQSLVLDSNSLADISTAIHTERCFCLLLITDWTITSIHSLIRNCAVQIDPHSQRWWLRKFRACAGDGRMCCRGSWWRIYRPNLWSLHEVLISLGLSWNFDRLDWFDGFAYSLP